MFLDRRNCCNVSCSPDDFEARVVTVVENASPLPKAFDLEDLTFTGCVGGAVNPEVEDYLLVLTKVLCVLSTSPTPLS